MVLTCLLGCEVDPTKRGPLPSEVVALGLEELWSIPLDGTASGLNDVEAAAFSHDGLVVVLDPGTAGLYLVDRNGGRVRRHPLGPLSDGSWPALFAMRGDTAVLASATSPACRELLLSEAHAPSDCEIGVGLAGRRTDLLLDVAFPGSVTVAGAFGSLGAIVEWNRRSDGLVGFGSPSPIEAPGDSMRLRWGASFVEGAEVGYFLSRVYPPEVWLVERAGGESLLWDGNAPAVRELPRAAGGGQGPLIDTFPRTIGTASFGGLLFHAVYAPELDQSFIRVFDQQGVRAEMDVPFYFRPIASDGVGLLLVERWIDGRELVLYEVSVDQGLPRGEAEGSSLGESRDQTPILDTAWTVGLHSSSDEVDAGSFGYISQIVATPDDGLWVLDIMLRRVMAYDAEGRLRLEFGRRGWGPGELQDPISMALTGEHLVIRDLGRQGYALYDTEGAFVESVPDPEAGPFIREPMMADGTGRVWDSRSFSTDTSSVNRLFAFRPGEDDSLALREAVPRSPHPAVEVLDESGQRSGGYVQLPHAPRFHWAVLSDGRVIAAEGDMYEIGVWEEGRLSETWGRAPRSLPVPQAIADSMVAGVREQIAERAELLSIDPTPTLRQVEPPEVWPEILGLATDPLGRVWVRVPSGDADILEFDVLSSTGDLVAGVRLRMPAPNELLPGLLSSGQGVVAFGEGMAYVGLRSPLGVHGVAAYRISGLEAR